MPQWLAREFLARRGSAKFRPDQVKHARCPLLGFAMRSMQIEGTTVAKWFLETHTQPEIGEEAYDKGAEILYGFFHRELANYLEDDLDPLGRDIIQCCLDRGSVDDYITLLPGPQ